MVSTPLDKAANKLALNRRWFVAAGVLVALLGGVFTLTEATGVTQFRGTVTRIFTPDGTLIVATDDPAIKITVEGDGGLSLAPASKKFAYGRAATA